MLANCVKETVSEAPLTGDILLGGKLSNKYIAVSQKFADGAELYYLAEDGDDSELAMGVYNSGANSITRTTPIETIDSGVHDDSSPSVISLTAATIVHIVSIAQVQNGKARLTDATYKYFIPSNFIIYGENGKGGGEYSASAGRITARPIYFAHKTKITTLGGHVNDVSAGGNFDMAIHATLPGSMKGGDLLASSGDLSTAVSGLVSATLGSPIHLTPGWYWLLVKVDNTVATIRGARPGGGRMVASPIGGDSSQVGQQEIGYWNTAYADAFLSAISAYGVYDGHTKWATPEAILS